MRIISKRIIDMKYNLRMLLELSMYTLHLAATTQTLHTTPALQRQKSSKSIIKHSSRSKPAQHSPQASSSKLRYSDTESTSSKYVDSLISVCAYTNQPNTTMQSIQMARVDMTLENHPTGKRVH